jgi:hypothetical protein
MKATANKASSGRSLAAIQVVVHRYQRTGGGVEKTERIRELNMGWIRP